MTTVTQTEPAPWGPGAVRHPEEPEFQDLNLYDSDWLVGHRSFTGQHHEREPNRFDDPESYEAEE